MNYRRLFLSFRGRIARQWFWIGSLLAVVAGSASNLMAGSFYQLELSSFGDVRFGGSVAEPFLHAPLSNPINLSISIFQTLSFISLFYAGLALMAKRWHDRDKSGWWSLIALVPVIGWAWVVIECGLLSGTPGTNRYGTDPLVDPVEALDRTFGYEV